MAGPKYGDVCVAGCCGGTGCCVNLLGGLEDGGVAGDADRCEVEDSCWEDLCFLTYLLRPAMCGDCSYSRRHPNVTSTDVARGKTLYACCFD